MTQALMGDPLCELLRDYVRTLDLHSKRILVVDDFQGELCLELGQWDVTSYTDSFVIHDAIAKRVTGVAQIHQLSELSGQYDLVLVRLPKNLGFFEDLLCHLTGHLGPGSQVVCSYKMKHHAAGSFDLLNQLIGQTTTSLARKKSRLIFASFEKSTVKSPFPCQVALDGFAQPFVNHSNLFSRDKLDRGTRFLLENLPAEIFESVLDLGCGNGILGIAFKLAHPSAQVIFSDESKMAILSASENYRNFFGDPAQFYWTHCFPTLLDGTVDLVLCNPPFHQGTSIVDTVALEMFRDGRRILRTGGVMRVIGNHHLNYPSTLKKTFGNSRIVASNDKFTIVDAIKSYL